MTREEILEKLQKENPHSIPVLKAMSEFAQQEAIAFAEWKDKNVQKHNGKYYVFTYEDPFDNNTQLYSLFKQQP